MKQTTFKEEQDDAKAIGLAAYLGVYDIIQEKGFPILAGRSSGIEGLPNYITLKSIKKKFGK